MIDANQSFLVACQGYRSLQGVFKLADITGPGILPESLHGQRINAIHGLAHLPRKLMKKVKRQGLNIFLALTKRGHMNGNDADAVIKVLAEVPAATIDFQARMVTAI